MGKANTATFEYESKRIHRMHGDVGFCEMYSKMHAYLKFFHFFVWLLATFFRMHVMERALKHAKPKLIQATVINDKD